MVAAVADLIVTFSREGEIVQRRHPGKTGGQA